MFRKFYCWNGLDLQVLAKFESGTGTETGAQRSSGGFHFYSITIYHYLTRGLTSDFTRIYCNCQWPICVFLNLETLLIFTGECKTIIIFAHRMTMNRGYFVVSSSSFTFSMANKTGWQKRRWWLMEKLLTNFLLILLPLFCVCLFIQYVLNITISHAPSPFGPNVERVYVMCTRVYAILFAIKLFVRRRFIYISRSSSRFFSLSISMQSSRKSQASTSKQCAPRLHRFWLSLFAILRQNSASRYCCKKHTQTLHILSF